jgi:carboxymethylenebutenolidase
MRDAEWKGFNMKRLMITGGLLAAVAVNAQDWATAKLEDSPRHQEWVTVEHGDRKVESFLVFPEVNEKATAVVVIHEIFGLSDWARLVTDEFAEAGYIAIAPDLLSGMAPNGGGTRELGGEARRAISSLPPEQITADLNAVVAHVSQLPACNGKVVVAGFCWGGGQTFRFATNNREIDAALSFYGPTITDEAEIARIACPVYGFYGENDARINVGIPEAEQKMKAAEKTYEPVIYDGAGHGFLRAGEAPDASEENKKARDEAWVRIKEVLSEL